MHQPLNMSLDDPWMTAMRRGDFNTAWAISDNVLRRRQRAGLTCWDWPRHLQFVWNGQPLAGKRVLVRCYHGLGDTIQFIRFAASLREIAREVVAWAQPALLPLIATAPGVDRVLPLHDGRPEVSYDADTEIMELPHALRIMNPARQVPYLFPVGQACCLDQGPELKVGIVWTAGEWDPRRSLPTDLPRALAQMSGIRLFSLQRGAAGHDAAELGLIDISCDDVNRTARRMQHLDLVISVDTMAAHLAGALGRPVWTLLHAGCDWRWGQNRSDTPWYPTMRLFRQNAVGDWRPVIEQVCSALASRAASSSSSSSLRSLSSSSSSSSF
jgi:hypothetical protein